MSLWKRLFGGEQEDHHHDSCLDDECAEERLTQAHERIVELERRARELEFEVNIQTNGRRRDDRRHRY